MHRLGDAVRASPDRFAFRRSQLVISFSDKRVHIWGSDDRAFHSDLGDTDFEQLGCDSDQLDFDEHIGMASSFSQRGHIGERVGKPDHCQLDRRCFRHGSRDL